LAVSQLPLITSPFKTRTELDEMSYSGCFFSLGIYWESCRPVPRWNVGSVEGSGVQGEGDGGIRCNGETPQKKIKILTLEGDKRWNAFIWNNSWIIQ